MVLGGGEGKLCIPRLGIVLLELNLVQGNDFTGRVEDEKAGAGGSLVDGTDKGLGAGGRHGAAFLGDGVCDEVG